MTEDNKRAHNGLQRSRNFFPEIRCAIIDNSDDINDTEISSYMRETTLNFLRNNYSFYKSPLYENKSVDAILHNIYETDPKEDEVVMVVFQAYGNLLSDTWQPTEHGYSLFREYCNFEYLPMAQENKFLVMGHILDDVKTKNRWYRLHEQCFVVNYKLWKEIGKPEFGGYSRTPRTVRQAIRSTENFHDSHTPKFLAPGPAFETIEKTGLGWNFINESLKMGLAVPNFDEQARKTKTYLYPEVKEDQAEFKKYFKERAAFYNPRTTTLTGSKKEFYDYQYFTIQRSPDAIWVFNTESVDDIDRYVWNKKPLKNLHSVSAGYKTLAFLRNWHPDTKISDVNLTYFDISQNALDVRKWMHEEWDYTNFNQFLDYIKDNYFSKDIGLISIYDDFDYESPNWENDREKANAVNETSILRIFDSMNEFYDMMGELRDKKINYVRSNLIGDYSELLTTVKKSDAEYDDVFWSSNYITTRYCNWILSYDERKHVYQQLIRDLGKINDKIRIHSSDWDSSPMRSIPAKELIDAYNLDTTEFLKWRKKNT